ncbi:MAG TPA: CoA-binding protein [Rhodoblastus sp.]|nr:CoA-binding protein [Rhodoblastus sp.]
MTVAEADFAHAARPRVTVESFLAPKTIAVVGAAPSAQRSIRGALVRMLKIGKFSGEILPVNPSYPEVDGWKCYPSVTSIMRPIDLAIIAVPAPAVLDVVRECADRGVKSAIIISSGFAEESEAGAVLQRQVREVARISGMRICGPNCEGFHSAANEVAATFSPTVSVVSRPAHVRIEPARYSVVAQSGGLGFSIYERGHKAGVSFNHVVTTGNECDLTTIDFIEHFVDEPCNDGVIAYLEEVRDTARLLDAAERAHRIGKTIIAIKIGRTEAGRRAARFHTASDTGSIEAARNLFSTAGIVEVADADEAIAAALACATNPPISGNRVGIVTTAGGAGTVLSDALGAAGFAVPELSEALQASLRPTFPSYGSAANPIDVTAQGIFTGGALKTFKELIDEKAVDAIVLALSLSNDRAVSINIETLRKLSDLFGKPVLVHSYTTASVFARDAFARAGFVLFEQVRDVVVGLRALARMPLATR